MRKAPCRPIFPGFTSACCGAVEGSEHASGRSCRARLYLLASGDREYRDRKRNGQAQEKERKQGFLALMRPRSVSLDKS